MGLHDFANMVDEESMTRYDIIQRNLEHFMLSMLGGRFFQRHVGVLFQQLENEDNPEVLTTVLTSQIIEAIAGYNSIQPFEYRVIVGSEMVTVEVIEETTLRATIEYLPIIDSVSLSNMRAITLNIPVGG